MSHFGRGFPWSSLALSLGFVKRGLIDPWISKDPGADGRGFTRLEDRLRLGTALAKPAGMGHPFSANPPKPRSWISLPGYPTLAAAGFFLCVSPGCGSDDSTKLGGGAPALYNDASVPKPAPSDASVPTPDSQPVPTLGGAIAAPFDAAPPQDTEAVSPPDLAPTPDSEPVPSEPPLAGGAPVPY